MTTPVALLSSPLQALSLIEAAHIGALQESHILIAPNVTLDSTTMEDLQALGEVRTGGPIASRTLFTTPWLVLGDPYSRLGQLALIARRCDRVSILEDGAATYHAISQLLTGASLQRAGDTRVKPTRLQQAALRRLARIHDARQLDWFLHRTPDIHGATVVTHRFEHLRSTNGVIHPGVTRVVAGSALVSDGYLQPNAYLGWLAETFALDGPVLFKPHRRELAASFELATAAGVTIDTGRGPIERLIHRMDDVACLHTLPSTPALTCQVVRPGITVHLAPLSRWWKPNTPPGVIGLAEMVHHLASQGK